MRQSMRRTASLVVCLLMTLPILADDGAAPDPQPVLAPPAEGRIPAKPVIADPFAAPNADRGQEDPFGGGSVDTPTADPFGGPPQISPPSVADPFSVRTAKPPQLPQQTTPQHRTKPSVSSVPSLAVEATSDAVRHIEQQLGQATTFDYLDTPLQDMIEDVGLQHDVPIVINRTSLEEFGIGTDIPVTINLKGVSLKSALHLALRELELTYIVADEVLQITTRETAEAMLRSRYYAVSMLLPSDRDGSYLTRLITTHVAPDSWNEVGGTGAITYVDHLETLVVTQTEEVHDQIDAMFSAMVKLTGQATSR